MNNITQAFVRGKVQKINDSTHDYKLETIRLQLCGRSLPHIFMYRTGNTVII